MKLALFDFDGTVTTKNSVVFFILYMAGIRKFLLGSLYLGPFFLLYILGIISNHFIKETAFKYFFKGWDVDDFNMRAKSFVVVQIPVILRAKGIERIKWHKQQGHKVVIVSASIPNYLGVWCKDENIEMTATELEVKDNKITGRLAGKNCYGIEKANLIKQKYNLDDFDYIYGYGNSRGDLNMLSIVDEAYYKGKAYKKLKGE
ncbi:HAD-IB family hydrolase [bacterium]